jgi:methylase of polypeptide subunit release factors
MYKWIKEREYNKNAVQISPKLRVGIESFLNKKNPLSQELTKRASYFLQKWEFDDYQIGHEFLRKIDKQLPHQDLLRVLKYGFISKVNDNEYDLSLARPSHCEKISRIADELIDAVIKDDIPGYIDSYEIFGDYMHIGWSVIKLHKWTMVPRLTTLEIVNQVSDFIESHKDTDYQIIDIWTGETNFIPQVIRQNNISHNVWWFDVEMMFDDTWKRIVGNFSDWSKIKPYIHWNDLIITANLPYSPEEDIKTFHSSVQRESESTWHRSFKWWWKDGLDLYRMYIDDISSDKENIT